MSLSEATKKLMWKACGWVPGGKMPNPDLISWADIEKLVQAARTESPASTGGVPGKLGNTPTVEVLEISADMLDEAGKRLGGLADMPVMATKLRSLAATLQGGNDGR